MNEDIKEETKDVNVQEEVKRRESQSDQSDQSDQEPSSFQRSRKKWSSKAKEKWSGFRGKGKPSPFQRSREKWSGFRGKGEPSDGKPSPFQRSREK